jgi:lysophospholipase L1-like esterase
MRIQPGQKLILIGDSITDAGRARPIGEGLFDAIGKGYVQYVDALLGATYPSHGIRVVNVGISGNTVRDLKARWKTDVEDLKPDWLSVCIGINDVWRQFDLPRQKEVHVGPEEYAATLRQLITSTRPALRGLVMMTPYYIEPNRADPMRRRMDEYGQIVRQIAGEADAIFIDLQAAFDEAMKTYYPATLAWDRVHPNHIGTMIIARAFLNGIGFQW